MRNGTEDSTAIMVMTMLMKKIKVFVGGMMNGDERGEEFHIKKFFKEKFSRENRERETVIIMEPETIFDFLGIF